MNRCCSFLPMKTYEKSSPVELFPGERAHRCSDYSPSLFPALWTFLTQRWSQSGKIWKTSGCFAPLGHRGSGAVVKNPCTFPRLEAEWREEQDKAPSFFPKPVFCIQDPGLESGWGTPGSCPSTPLLVYSRDGNNRTMPLWLLQTKVTPVWERHGSPSPPFDTPEGGV